MRVLMLTPCYLPAFRMGGPVVAVSGLSEELVRLNHHVSVVTTNANLDMDLDYPDRYRVEINGVEVTYCRRRPSSSSNSPIARLMKWSRSFERSPRRQLAALILSTPTCRLFTQHLKAGGVRSASAGRFATASTGF